MSRVNVPQYAVIGNPVEHSLSPKIHAIFAKQTGRSLEYRKILSDIKNFDAAATAFFSNGGKGCNITVPFKQDALALADTVSETAKIAQAVNCLTKQEDGSLQGDNFDGVGLVQDLTHNLRYLICQKKILIIGAGGATRGILAPLLEKAPEAITIANRNADKAIELADNFSEYGNLQAVSLGDIPHRPFDLIIHATSLGHQGNAPELPAVLVNDDTFCYDLSYGTAANPFLSWARACGAKRCQNGLGMLIEQAAASFYLWHGVYPDTQIKILG